DSALYPSIQIGDQCWMQKNLSYLPEVNQPNNGSQHSNYYYVYGFDDTDLEDAKITINYGTYGVLYNWPAAMSACPEGWHLPNNQEWSVLLDFSEGNDGAGGEMKQSASDYWKNPNTGSTNSSMFSGLPGGFRYNLGFFYKLSENGFWWSSTEHSGSKAWSETLDYQSAGLFHNFGNKEYGFSVRCIKNN
nr:fibrobacter succinogenes major paralogous domain-containing protein [Bacteroidota bacterium]